MLPVVFLLLATVAIGQKNEPYTQFIENNTKIQWAAEYTTLVNLTPVTNTVSLKKYYLKRVKTDSVKAYRVSNHVVTGSYFLGDKSLERQDWLQDHYVISSDRPDRWQFNNRKQETEYRVSGLSNEECCGCDEADAFLVNQVLYYSNHRMYTRNFFLSPLCARKTGERTAAWYPMGLFAFNNATVRPSASTFLTTSKPYYPVNTRDSVIDFAVLSLGEDRLVEHLMKDIEAGKLSVRDAETGEKLSYEKFLSWKMPIDTVAVYDLEGNTTGYQFVQQLLQPSDFSSIRLVQDWYFDFKSERLFSEVRSIILMMDARGPDGSYRGRYPFVSIDF